MLGYVRVNQFLSVCLCVCVQCVRLCSCTRKCVCVRVYVFVCVCTRACVRACGATFSGGEHGGGQLTLLGLQVSQGEPAGIPAGNHGDAVVGVAHVPRSARRLQHRQPIRRRESWECVVRVVLTPFSFTGLGFFFLSFHINDSVSLSRAEPCGTTTTETKTKLK